MRGGASRGSPAARPGAGTPAAPRPGQVSHPALPPPFPAVAKLPDPKLCFHKENKQTKKSHQNKQKNLPMQKFTKVFPLLPSVRGRKILSCTKQLQVKLRQREVWHFFSQVPRSNRHLVESKPVDHMSKTSVQDLMPPNRKLHWPALHPKPAKRTQSLDLNSKVH